MEQGEVCKSLNRGSIWRHTACQSHESVRGGASEHLQPWAHSLYLPHFTPWSDRVQRYMNAAITLGALWTLMKTGGRRRLHSLKYRCGVPQVSLTIAYDINLMSISDIEACLTFRRRKVVQWGATIQDRSLINSTTGVLFYPQLSNNRLLDSKIALQS